MKKFIVKVDGNQYEVEVEEVLQEGSVENIVSAPKPAPAPAQKAQPVKAPAEKPKAAVAPVSKDVPAGAEAVTAPMPGVIMSVAASVGAKVKAGDVLLILEAMKMENEITSPKDGEVAAINVQKGASVNAGDVLISIK